MTVAIPYMINPDQANWRGKIGFFYGKQDRFLRWLTDSRESRLVILIIKNRPNQTPNEE